MNMRKKSLFSYKTEKFFQTVYFFAEIVYNGSNILYKEKSMRIWAKLMVDGKIQKQYVYELTEKLTYSHFFDYLTEICHELDIPTPVILKTHIFNFAKFNRVKFTPKDFVESFPYDRLEFENIIL